jgi:ADP-ribosylglycohydrolase
MATITQRASGCLFGLAFGDALGADTEFLNVAEIVRRYPPDGLRTLQGHPARVTDDTQMALAVGEALLSVSPPYTAAKVGEPLQRAFVAWSESPENNRAPGMTCMSACRQLARGIVWYEATVAQSKGCGANMRVAPAGLLPHCTPETRAALAQFQAALTHGHPTGLTAADLTATTVAYLAAGNALPALPAYLRDYIHSQRTYYHETWLGPLWQRSRQPTPAAFIAQGWDECLLALDRLEDALKIRDREQDPCLFTGEGWVAEEAFATGLLCFLFYSDEPREALRRAATTSGDSDSIACLTGAFAGAYHGLAIWPADWVERIEYRDRLARLGAAWD